MNGRGYQFSEGAVRRIARAVRKIEAMGPVGAKAGKSNRRPVYKKVWYKIASYDQGTGEYTVRKQAWNIVSGELEEVTDINDPEYDADVIAYECGGREVEEIGEIVPGWKTYCDGQWVTLISANRRIVPQGVIVAWSGGEAPSGWTLCDGRDDSRGSPTPDLRGRFIVGRDMRVTPPEWSDTNYETIGNTGGLKDYPLDKAIAQQFNGLEPPWMFWGYGVFEPEQRMDNRPPYYVLAYIRKD